MTHGRFKAWQAGLLLAASCASLGGCQNFDRDVNRMMEPFIEPAPGQVAREAFNLYDADKRRRAVNLLSAAKFGGEEPYVQMYRKLLFDQDATVRAACVKALGLHGEPSDVPEMLPLLVDNAPFVRWETAKALQRLHHPDAVGPLMDAAAKDEDGDVRMSAAYALGQYPQTPVFNVLVGALTDTDFGVRVSAARSLHLLTGQDLGSDGAAWIRWSRDNPKTLFSQQMAYTWEPYVKPRGFFSKLKFWEDDAPPQPQPPRGLNAAAPQPAPAAGS